MNNKRIIVIVTTAALVLLITLGVFFLTRSMQEENPKPDTAPVEQPSKDTDPPKEIPKAQETPKETPKVEEEPTKEPEKTEPAKTPAKEEETIAVQGSVTQTQQEEAKEAAKEATKEEAKEATKAEAKAEANYFSFASQPAAISVRQETQETQGSGVTIELEDAERIKSILNELTNLQGKKEAGSLNASIHEWVCTLTIPISDTVSYVYNMWDDYNTQDATTSLLEVGVKTKDTTGAATVESKGIYRTQKSIKTIRGLLDKSMSNGTVINCFSSNFLQQSIQADQVILCDNDIRQSADVSLNRLDIIRAFSQLKILNEYTSDYDSKMGKIFPGVEQIRLKNPSTSFFTYTLYEKGILVQSYDKEDTFYECATEELISLYKLASSFYQEKQVVPSWLGIMSLKTYDSMQIYSSANGQKQQEGLIYDHSVGLFAALQKLNIQKGSLENLKFMPPVGTYYIEMKFKTGVVYTINIEGSTLSIESSDIPGILQYTLLMNESYTQFINELNSAMAK